MLTISKEQFLMIKAKKAEGVPIAYLAREMGVSQPTIRKWLQLSEEEFDNAYAESKSVYSKYREYILSLLQLLR